ncbi:Hypothetical protein HVR_LOCUS462 [uncultured virus]|nr:Hypothetical protein HVR_LOCUS462 [uncultured virus]
MYILILAAIAITLIVIAICIAVDMIPPPVSKAQHVIDINPATFQNINSLDSTRIQNGPEIVNINTKNSLIPMGMYNLSVRKISTGYSGLIRGCTWNGCHNNNTYPVFSYPYHITLDNDGTVLTLDRINLNYSLLNKCDKSYRDIHANGIEDPKLFIYRDEEWCIGSCLGTEQQPHPCINSMCIFKITDPRNTFKVIIPPSWVGALQRQKNWSPFEWNGRLLCEYTIQPHVIIEIDPTTGKTQELCRSGTGPDNITQLSSMRGGAPPILINLPSILETNSTGPTGDQILKFNTTYDRVYIGIGHTHPSKISGYVHFFYMFEPNPPFKIIGISDIFKMDRIETIQFAAGMSIQDDNVYISYGVNDCSNRISRYDLADVLISLASKDQPFK